MQRRVDRSKVNHANLIAVVIAGKEGYLYSNPAWIVRDTNSHHGRLRDFPHPHCAQVVVEPCRLLKGTLVCSLLMIIKVVLYIAIEESQATRL